MGKVVDRALFTLKTGEITGGKAVGANSPTIHQGAHSQNWLSYTQALGLISAVSERGEESYPHSPQRLLLQLPLYL